MKTILLALAAVSVLAGCAVVPYEPAPVAVAPAVVVRPAYGYYGHPYYGPRHYYWR